MRADVYDRITNQIVTELEQGVRPWLKPWNAQHAAGRITRPLRANGVPYRGINVLVLWGEALDKGYGSTIWMTFKQAVALGGHVRRGEHGAVIVYADRIIRTETDERGQDVEREIPCHSGKVGFSVPLGMPEYVLDCRVCGGAGTLALLAIGATTEAHPDLTAAEVLLLEAALIGRLAQSGGPGLELLPRRTEAALAEVRQAHQRLRNLLDGARRAAWFRERAGERFTPDDDPAEDQ